MAETIRIEVVAGNADRQQLVMLELAEGATLADAIKAANLDPLPGDATIDVERAGVFGKRCRPDHCLNDGDRVEIYQPLKADPKEVRRQLAELERARKKGS